MNYFIIERQKPDMKEYLSTVNEEQRGWRPTPNNAYQFPSAVLAEVERQSCAEQMPGYTYTLVQVSMQLSPCEVTIKPVATKRGTLNGVYK